jgi:hypothetical protein
LLEPTDRVAVKVTLMRFLIKMDIRMSKMTRCREADGSDLENELTRLYLAVGALSAYTRINEDGSRTDAVVVEISDARELKPKAKMIFELLNVRPRFMLETDKKDAFGF